MLKKLIIRKILVTITIMFIVLTLFTIPTIEDRKNVLRTSLSIEDITNIDTSKIYLLNDKGLFTQTEIFVDGKNTIEQIKKIISYLTINNREIPIGLKGYIPNKTKLLDIKIEKEILYLNFSKELLNNNMDIIITGIVYSLIDIDSINSISIKVDGNYIPKYEKLLDKNIGINNNYLFNSRKNISKVVIYYLDKIGDNTYYIPITNYLNDNREKIEIIVDELKKSSFNQELITTLNPQVILQDYKEENNVFFLNFNDCLLEDNTSKDMTLKAIAYSVFDNYEVNMVMFQVNNKKIKYVKKQ